jgi:predicted nucleic acid-binding protein
MSNSIISNTSPLIALSAIGDVDLLPQILASVLIPKAVEREIKAGTEPWHVKVAVEQAILAGWMTVVAARANANLSFLQERLGAGEAEAIALAVEQDLPVLIDDRLGRKMAADLNLVVTGTLGVLAKAKLKGLIGELAPRIQRLRGAGIHYSNALIERILHEMGES